MSAIAYCITAATFILYAVYLVLPIVFSFIAFARMKGARSDAMSEADDLAFSETDPEIEEPIVPIQTSPANEVSNRPDCSTAPSQDVPRRSSVNSVQPGNPYDFFKFRLTGVTFNNTDGTSRQALLRKMRFRDTPFDGGAWDVQIQQYEYKDEDAVGIYVNSYMIGNVPREKVSYVVSNWDRIDRVTALEVIGGGRDEDGNALSYGAEVCIRFYKHASQPEDTAVGSVL